MSNKFVKISIVLIFMLFVMGLFNFCFAYEFDINQFNIEYTFDLQRDTYIGTYDVDFDRMTKDNVINQDNEYTNAPTMENIENYTKIYHINFDNNTLYCVVLPSISGDLSEGYYREIYQTSVDGNGLFQFGGGSYFYNYVYDFENRTWEWKSKATSIMYANYIFAIDNELKIYDDNLSTNLLFSSDDFDDTPPTDDELITGCDFNVRLEFGNSENLLDTYPTNNHIGMQQVTIIHSLTNWSNYNVKLNITLENYGWLISQRFHYSMYSLNMTDNEIKNVDTVCIEEPVSLDITLNDYLAIYSAQEDKYVRLVYKVYSKFTGELLLTRMIRFRFDGDGFILQDSSDINGSILEDTLQDSDGNIIDNSDNNIVSNGTDLSDINNDFDFSSGFDLDVDTLRGTLDNSIESSKSFFNLFSTFLGLLPIWISTLLYFFLFGIIVITLYRFIRGA